jgi:hypothetical protein
MSESRWYPSKSQLDSPEKLERAFRQLLTQHYAHVDKVNAMQIPKEASSSGVPPGSGPSDSMLLGLRVAPTDPQALADGAKLTYSKKDGVFKFM